MSSRPLVWSISPRHDNAKNVINLLVTAEDYSVIAAYCPSVYLSVGLSVCHDRESCKTAEPIEMQ